MVNFGVVFDEVVFPDNRDRNQIDATDENWRHTSVMGYLGQSQILYARFCESGIFIHFDFVKDN